MDRRKIPRLAEGLSGGPICLTPRREPVVAASIAGVKPAVGSKSGLASYDIDLLWETTPCAQCLR
jgi:hypothetical protein